jgi:hypothetical protein
MADYSFAVAVIGTITTAVAGAVPVVTGWIERRGKDMREQADRRAAERLRAEAERLRLALERRGECNKLLKLTLSFRVQLENAHESQGDELTIRVREIRQAAAVIAGQADDVGYMLPGTEATASGLAAEVSLRADALSDERNRARGAPLEPPDLKRLDKALADFRTAAHAALSVPPAPTADSLDGVTGALRQELTVPDGQAP